MTGSGLSGTEILAKIPVQLMRFAATHPFLIAVSRYSLTAAAESIGVAVGAISGFLIVHQLTKEAYARYSFLVVCVTFLVGLSDIGLSHCYLPLAAERRSDQRWVLGACRRLYQLRWRFFLPAAAIVACYWLFATIEHKWTDTQFLLASALAALTVVLTVREQSCRSVLIVLRQVLRVNRMTLVSSIARLLLVAVVLLYLPIRLALLGLLIASALGSAAALWQLRGVGEINAFNQAELGIEERRTVDQRVQSLLRPLILPMTFYQVQGLITIFLVSLLGVTSSIAEVGALTRPTLILAILDRVLGVLLFPAIAGAGQGRTLHLLVIRSQAVYFALMLFILASSVWHPDWWMLLIGQQYAPQQGMLWMAFLSAIMMYSAGFALSTLTARGKSAGQSLLIPLVLSVQLLFLITIGVGSTKAALWFSVSTSATFFVFQYGMLARRWLLVQWVALHQMR